jgi:hypothetical protein
MLCFDPFYFLLDAPFVQYVFHVAFDHLPSIFCGGECYTDWIPRLQGQFGGEELPKKARGLPLGSIER